MGGPQRLPNSHCSTRALFALVRPAPARLRDRGAANVGDLRHFGRASAALALVAAVVGICIDRRAATTHAPRQISPLFATLCAGIERKSRTRASRAEPRSRSIAERTDCGCGLAPAAAAFFGPPVAVPSACPSAAIACRAGAFAITPTHVTSIAGCRRSVELVALASGLSGGRCAAAVSATVDARLYRTTADLFPVDAMPRCRARNRKPRLELGQ
jgi:hypothetical protein